MASGRTRIDVRLEDQEQASKHSPGHALPVRFDRVSLAFDDHVVLSDISFDVPACRMAILLGGSGAGKSIVLKLIVGLVGPDTGRIWVNGHRIDAMSESELMAVRADVGMVFQEGALFDSLTVGDKVGYVTHQLRDAFYIATHEAVREQQRVTIRPIPERRATDVEFMMLKDGRIQFKGATRDRVRPRIPTSGPSFPNPPPPRER